MSSDKTAPRDVPDIVVDRRAKKEYVRGRFLGKGGFAKCYEMTDKDTNVMYAGKVVSKALLLKSHQKEKMAQEITIHKSLDHKHVVGFHSYFEDEKNVYIILELCGRRSLMEMHRRRQTLTEPEVRYFLQHLVQACHYLVSQKVIHRDLKLGNLLLTDRMELKVGDFGLATRIDYEGERKKTLCGTPNYIAPEILGKKGHSYEVDVWSIGCILFTLLVGRPPFETSTLKETYGRIKKNEYHVPKSVSSPARNLINRMLQPEPERRPTIEAVLNDDFMHSGPLPRRLPVSCLTTAPRFDTLNASFVPRKPLLELNTGAELDPKVTPIPASKSGKAPIRKPASTKPTSGRIPAAPSNPPADPEEATAASAACQRNRDHLLGDLLKQLQDLVAARPQERKFTLDDDAEDPASVPVFWVSKWVDYTDKYGLGYQLCDNSIGVLFNDNTRIILLNNQKSVTYVDDQCIENYYAMDGYPATLEKKMTLLRYFSDYMKQFLLKAGESVAPREVDDLVRLPCLGSWFRTHSAIVLYLTNGTVQLNFFQDHTKIILCPLMGAVSYIDQKKTFRTYRLETLQKMGCPEELFSRLKYAKGMVERLAREQ
ncbi:serine/threonine-protein kinase PLK1 [Ixodes scapularis]|uniref:serine/threonine-protein kinase PLK1 n=1 Tax=Ixodes scapularis TaxID=6945 RepID=UPI001A9E42AE|nr:serine/threonine-protein kinase PLK1 [Ixodes scapularis]